MDLSFIWSWVTQNVELVITVVSAIIAVIGAFFSASETRAQRRLQRAAVRVEIDRQGLEWGHEVINTLAEAEALANGSLAQTELEFQTYQARFASALSALADRGRLFFPNYQTHASGQDKDKAFRGQRPPALYAILYAHYEVKTMSWQLAGSKRSSAGFIFNCRRLFVSELQSFLDPRQRDQLVERAALSEEETADALLRAAKLGVELDHRHPGVLLRHKDDGVLHKLSEADRQSIRDKLEASWAR